MNPYFRDLGPAKPITQLELAHITGWTELPINQELHRAHWGEDGPGFHVITTREFNITDQMMWSGNLRPWAIDELLESLQ